MDDLISDEFRREICDWFRVNDVDPSLLPAQPKASIHEGQLTFRQRVPGSGDGCLMDPDEPGMPLLRTVTVPLKVQPPERVAQWLGPACPVWVHKHPCSECGRGWISCLQAGFNWKCCAGCDHPGRWNTNPPYTPEEIEEMQAGASRG